MGNRETPFERRPNSHAVQRKYRPKLCYLSISGAVLSAAGLLPVAWGPQVLFYTSVLACIGCVYLAWVLFFVLKDLCVVCLATYWANFALLYLNHARLA